MDKSKQDILILIRKLFAMADKSRGCTVHEAELAMDKAKKLMAEHNLSVSEVELEDMKTGKAQTANTVATSRRGLKIWERILASACSNLFEVGFYSDRSYGTDLTHLHFYGCEVDVALACEAYTLLRKLAQLSAKYLENFGDRNQWRLGFVHAIAQRAKAQVTELTAQQQSKNTGLMIVKNQLVKKMASDIGIVSKPMNVRARVASDAYSAGYAKGQKESLSFRKELK